MVSPPDEEESCLMIRGFMGVLARSWGLDDEEPETDEVPTPQKPVATASPAVIPFPVQPPPTNERRKRWYIEFGCTTSDAR
jgi:hypothetical protein